MTEPQVSVIYGDVSFRIFWMPSDPTRMRFFCSDPSFVDENGENPGIHLIASSNPESADYNPGVFNRAARAMRARGLEGPDEVPVLSRRLKDRQVRRSRTRLEKAQAQLRAAQAAVSNAEAELLELGEDRLPPG